MYFLKNKLQSWKNDLALIFHLTQNSYKYDFDFTFDENDMP